jgi:hypothetical protein
MSLPPPYWSLSITPQSTAGPRRTYHASVNSVTAEARMNGGANP